MERSEGVRRAAHIALHVTREHWNAARSNRDAINAHWANRSSENPSFFNGRVHVLSSLTHSEKGWFGSFLEVTFAEFLAWRDGVFKDENIKDSFGSGVVMGSDGAVLLGRQAAGNLNAGFTYPPGGFIDPRDVNNDGRIGIADSVAREVAEETGLDVRGQRPAPPFRIVFTGQMVAFGVCWRLDLTGAEMLDIANDHVARHPDSELEGVIVVRHPQELRDYRVPRYAELLVRDVLEYHPGL